MLDPKPVIDDLFEFGHHRPGLAESLVGQHDMSAESRVTGADRPHVQVMHLIYTSYLPHSLAHLRGMQSFGRAFIKDMNRLAQHSP